MITLTYAAFGSFHKRSSAPPVDCMTNLPITKRIRSAPAHVIYSILAVLSFVAHGVIYQLTSFSVILVRPEFYFNRFVIRDTQGQSVGEVSLTAG